MSHINRNINPKTCDNFSPGIFLIMREKSPTFKMRDIEHNCEYMVKDKNKVQVTRDLHSRSKILEF